MGTSGCCIDRLGSIAWFAQMAGAIERFSSGVLDERGYEEFYPPFCSGR
jgi:hypothetical protein